MEKYLKWFDFISNQTHNRVWEPQQKNLIVSLLEGFIKNSMTHWFVIESFV